MSVDQQTEKIDDFRSIVMSFDWNPGPFPHVLSPPALFTPAGMLETMRVRPSGSHGRRGAVDLGPARSSRGCVSQRPERCGACRTCRHKAPGVLGHLQFLVLVPREPTRLPSLSPPLPLHAPPRRPQGASLAWSERAFQTGRASWRAAARPHTCWVLPIQVSERRRRRS